MRPPPRFRASMIVTLLPARASSRAAIKPAAPAPTIKKFVRCGGAIMAPNRDVVQCGNPNERFIAARGPTRPAPPLNHPVPGRGRADFVHTGCQSKSEGISNLAEKPFDEARSRGTVSRLLLRRARIPNAFTFTAIAQCPKALPALGVRSGCT